MNHVNKNGFTIIELMLAMSFISVLLVAIAVTTIQVTNIYTKGMTLREVNQAGRSISEELQRNISSSVPFDVSSSPDSKQVLRPGGGRLCVGRYTYAWNYGSALNTADVFNKYDDGSAVRFAKVSDPSGALCKAPITNTILRANATDMLTSGDRDLAMHEFKVTKTTEDTTIGQAIYAISMTIGTNDRAELMTDNRSCKAPSEGQGNENYCAVNQFELIARAGNKAGGN